MANEQSQRSVINILDDYTANRIAAGEVVERPASVVKELVENSIDALSSSITVYLEDGGKQLIKVVDNGCGMCRDDIVLCLQRHATSKIASADDLDSIATLGFRGEAIPSIASVSQMEIISKPAYESSGVIVEIEAGRINNLQHIGAPDGTTFSISNLFFNTPARLKFLKTSQTELGHITDIISSFALAYPNIFFKLIHNGKEVLTSPATGVRLNSIYNVMGKDIAKKMIEISFETQVMQVNGYVASPEINRNTRRDQTFFVNGRPIRSRTISHALEQAFKGLIQPGRYPLAVLFINMEPQLVDVNVHPTKAEVKFTSEHEVHSAVHRAVNDALMKGAAAPSISNNIRQTSSDLNLRPDYIPPVQNTISFTDISAQHDPNVSFRDYLDQRKQQLTAQSDADPFANTNQGVPMEESPVPEASFDAVRTVRLSGVRVIGQAKNTYILSECDDGVLIIDQHVAHERVLYDRMIRSSAESDTYIQRLIIPLTLSFSAREAAIIKHRLKDIIKSGFELEDFGQNTYVLRGVPANIPSADAEKTLKEMIEELLDLSTSKHLLVKADQVLITASCKMAVKAGEKLAQQEMEKLIEDLLKCDNPFVCPHGRPIIVSLSKWELDRKFRRS